MNNAHLHLVLNHLPIIFPIVGILILLIGFITKSETSKRNAYLIFILGALATIGAMATGEGAEEAVENLPGVTENLISTHEDAAELFAGLSYVLGGISLFGLIASLKNFALSKFMPYVTLVFAGITLFFAQQAGNTGGEIRHTEIRSGASVTNGENGEENSNKPEENKESDDD